MPTGKYTRLNRLTNALAFYDILQAQDGRAFDEHFADVLRQDLEPDFGQHPQILSAIEERRSSGKGEKPYGQSPSQVFGACCDLMQDMATALDKLDFLDKLLKPQRYCWSERRKIGQIDPKSDEEQVLWKEEFATKHVTRIPLLFPAAVLEQLRQQVDVAGFAPFSHGKLGYDFTMQDNITQALLSTLLGHEYLLRLLERICALPEGSLIKLNSRVYEMKQYRDDDGWHSDVDYRNKRVVAFGLNLEPRPVIGGDLLLKKTWSLRKRCRVPVSLFGELTIFRIHGKLVHRVSKVKGPVPRRYCVGWYGASEHFDYHTWLEAPL
jgi:hypothetical protein